MLQWSNLLCVTSCQGNVAFFVPTSHFPACVHVLRGGNVNILICAEKHMGRDVGRGREQITCEIFYFPKQAESQEVWAQPVYGK